MREYSLDFNKVVSNILCVRVATGIEIPHNQLSGALTIVLLPLYMLSFCLSSQYTRLYLYCFGFLGCQDTQHNETHHNDVTPHKGLCLFATLSINDTQHSDTHTMTLGTAMLSVKNKPIMLSVIILTIIMPSAVAPFLELGQISWSLFSLIYFLDSLTFTSRFKETAIVVGALRCSGYSA